MKTILAIALLSAAAFGQQCKPAGDVDCGKLMGAKQDMKVPSTTLIKPKVKAVEGPDGNFDISAKCPKGMDVHIDPDALKEFNANPDRGTEDALYLLVHHATCVKTPPKKTK